MNTELSPNEHLLRAREAAADPYRAGGYVYDQTQIRKAFSDGWDAALEYIEQQRHEWAVESLRLEREREQR